MQQTHPIRIGSVKRDLPIHEVAPDIRVALFNLLGDWELTEEAGRMLAQRIPLDIEVLIMPDGKAQALLHVIARESRLPSIIARKERKPYMGDTVVSASVTSITTQRAQCLYLSAEDMTFLKKKRVMMVDDVISTGATLETMRNLLVICDATLVGVMTVFTEGDERPDVITLGHLPLF